MAGLSYRAMIYGAALGVAAFALWVWHRGAAGVAQDVTGAAFGAASGAVVGIGQAVGIPSTDAAKCNADIAAGDMWAASFDCPAGNWLTALYQRATQ